MGRVMSFSLLPSIILNAVTDITPELLQSRGITLLMLDFDNTIVPYTTDAPTNQVLTWIRTMQESNIRLCVVSNSKRERVPSFCQQYGLSYITHARKPFSKGIRECLSRFQVMPGECALVGDQIYTDTLGANRNGVVSILVSAIDDHNIWLKLRHVAEMPWIAAARKRRIEL